MNTVKNKYYSFIYPKNFDIYKLYNILWKKYPNIIERKRLCVKDIEITEKLLQDISPVELEEIKC